MCVCTQTRKKTSVAVWERVYRRSERTGSLKYLRKKTAQKIHVCNGMQLMHYKLYVMYDSPYNHTIIIQTFQVRFLEFITIRNAVFSHLLLYSLNFNKPTFMRDFFNLFYT